MSFFITDRVNNKNFLCKKSDENFSKSRYLHVRCYRDLDVWSFLPRNLKLNTIQKSEIFYSCELNNIDLRIFTAC